jgi:hypothetical protein
MKSFESGFVLNFANVSEVTLQIICLPGTNTLAYFGHKREMKYFKRRHWKTKMMMLATATTTQRATTETAMGMMWLRVWSDGSVTAMASVHVVLCRTVNDDPPSDRHSTLSTSGTTSPLRNSYGDDATKRFSSSPLTRNKWSRDIQHNDTQHNDTHHKGFICDTKHK